jgi:hypothetical protein
MGVRNTRFSRRLGLTRRQSRVSTRKRALIVVLTLCIFLFVTAAAAFADIIPPGGVTFTNKTENCNGIIPTPGSENTIKTLTGGSLVPGGTAQYTIHYPENPNNVGDFAIADCVLMGNGADLKTYTVLDQGEFSLVNNSQDFTLTFHVDIPADAPIGARICNVAKTTESPSKSPASNRKAGPACFTVGGDVRIEKHSAADPTGALIPGATFVIWDCINSADNATLQPIVVTPAVSSGDIYSTSLAGGGVVHATGGFVAVSGPSGSTCNVTETVPPPGYQLPDTVTHSFTIPVGSSGATIINFVDPLAPGSIKIVKVAPASQSSTVFHFEIDCTNPTNTYTATITGSGNATVSNIPAGSSCQVVETDVPSVDTVSISPSGTFTVGSGQTVTVTVTNSLKPGSLTVTKVAPAGSTAVYRFTVTCTGDPNSPYTFSITGSDSHTITGIPAGSTCTVAETDPGATYNPPGYSPSNSVVIQPNATVTVTVTNTLKPGGLTVTKAAPAGSTESFSFTVTCAGDPNSPYTFTITGSDSHTITGIPAGSSCTVAETNPGGDFNAPTYSPNATVTVDPNATVTVTVTNTLKTGALQITKVAPAGSTATYNFTVTCTNPHTSPVGPYTATITGSNSSTITGIPAGSTCTVTETDPGTTYNPPTYSPSDTVLVSGDSTVTVTVTNTLKPGAVTITKVAPAEEQNTVFNFSLDCTNPTQHYDLQVTGSNSITQNNIPAGSSCQVTETGLPDVNNAPSIDPSGVFTVGATQTVTVTVTNTLKPLGILIEKSVTPTSGAPGDTVTYSYKVTNTGEVTLFNVLVTDDKLGTIGTIASLAPGASTTLTKTTTLPNNAGALTNVGTASGTDVLGRRATDTDTAVVTVVLALPPLVRTGTNDTGIGLVGVLFVAVGIALVTRKERGRVRPAFTTSGGVAGREVMVEAHRRSWRMRRRRGSPARARLRWRRSQGPPMRDGP